MAEAAGLKTQPGMNQDHINTLLRQVAEGSMPVSRAGELLKNLSFENIGYAHVDHHRSIRKGVPEVIFGEGKTSGQIIGIMEKMVQKKDLILATRLDREKAADIRQRFPAAVYHEDARFLMLEQEEPEITGHGDIIVISAGTSDIPVAKEAALTAGAMGNRVTPIYDVGVAGIHRLFAYRETIENAAVIVAVAGMEGALPSVVAGMVSTPVIAVPTSIGYGTSFGGLTALLGMLNSCSSNIAVVNIDNGFGAGYMAAAINHTGQN